MSQTDMSNKERRGASRIPVRFVGDEGVRGQGGDAPEVNNDSGLTPEELGRASSYEGEGEMLRRINRGGEEDSERGREVADDEDVAGTLNPSELPRSREDQDTTPSHAGDDTKSEGGEGGRMSDEPRKAEAAAPVGGPEVAELVATRAELKRVEAELKKLNDERQEWADKLARRQADFENFRKRTERERSETYSRALGEVVSRLLPVLDNLQRALDAERTLGAGESDEFRHFLSGVELINKQLNGVLEGLGVEVIPTVGHPFDPHVHEAVSTEETAEHEPDTVTQEMQRGYRLGERLLRPAMVKVAK